MTHTSRKMLTKILCYGGLLFTIISICENTDIANLFKEEKIVPIVIPQPPPSVTTVIYPKIGEITPGMNLTYSIVKNEPNVTWSCDPNNIHTLLFLAFENWKPKKDGNGYDIKRSYGLKWHPWIVYNIPGNNMSAGEILYKHLVMGDPLKPSIRDLYIFLVYEQKKKLQIQLDAMGWEDFEDRKELHSFIRRYNLSSLVAGNFYFRRCSMERR